MSRIFKKDRQKRIARIGSIHVGEKNEKNVPRSLDYFKATGDYADEFNRIYGKKPTKLEIVFMEDDPVLWRYEMRKGKKIFAFSENDYFSIWNGDKFEKKMINPDLQEDFIQETEKKTGLKFDEILTINFLLLDFKGVFGFWSFTTKGKESSIPSIVDSVDMVRDVAGTVKGIPFDLSIEMVTSQKPDSKSKFPVVSLVANMSSGNLEKISNFIEHGKKIRGIITEDKLTEQIEYDIVDSYKSRIDSASDVFKLKEISGDLENETEITEDQRNEIKEFGQVKYNEMSSR